MQALFLYTAIGAEAAPDSGSLVVTLFSMPSDVWTGVVHTVPEQGGTLDRSAFVSKMLMPPYPFDTIVG